MVGPGVNAERDAVWVVTACCGDYYCEGVHIVAVCDSEEAAREAVRKVAAGEVEGYVSWESATFEKRTLNEATNRSY